MAEPEAGIKSAVGKGTTIEVYVPRSRAPSEAATEWRDSKHRSVANGRGARVLVVDDQKDVREVAVAQIEAIVSQGLEAASADTALDLLYNCDSVNLMMVDYAMPGKSGIELASATRAKYPDLPLLIVTGYADTTHIDGQIPRARLMKKPYRLAELADAVESLLGLDNPQDAAANVVALRTVRKANSPRR